MIVDLVVVTQNLVLLVFASLMFQLSGGLFIALSATVNWRKERIRRAVFIVGLVGAVIGLGIADYVILGVVGLTVL